MGPFIRVLRLIDNEKMPMMKFIYEVMYRAKKIIQESFGRNGKRNKDILCSHR